ncbi:NAD(P)/FAD-dependent oxidoreductase [Nocardioidaceae bacterium]|nr:NAD(P)/FAD-dependent oxidoreductase [Nocardioidaceae bacterium]
MSHVTSAGDTPDHVDLVVVGAGPTGLYAAYYAGFRGLSVAVVDSLPELGGQVTALYPEKKIFDVAGFPVIKGRELVAGLVEQAAASEPTYLLGRTAVTIEPVLGVDGEPTGLEIGLGGDGHDMTGSTRGLTCGAALVTAGIGTFAPRPLPAAETWQGAGIEFFVPSLDPYVDADVVIVGGGDSAFDWALHLHEVARTVTLVHRRDRFRAHQATIDAVREAGVRIVAPAEVVALRDSEGGDGSSGSPLACVEVELGARGEEKRREVLAAHQVVAALGFLADISALKEWGLDLDARHVRVDTTMATSVPRVYAAGDITEYPGKVRLISVGFGEAATAVNNIAVTLDPESSLFPGHSSDV